MTRNLEPKSCSGFSVKARGVDEQQRIRELKQLCLQDGVEISDMIFEAIEHLFKVHHWPPGNPQLTLETAMLPKKQLTPHCRCGKVAVKEIYNVKTHVKSVVCARCWGEIPMRYDGGLWRWEAIP